MSHAETAGESSEQGNDEGVSAGANPADMFYGATDAVVEEIIARLRLHFRRPGVDAETAVLGTNATALIAALHEERKRAMRDRRRYHETRQELRHVVGVVIKCADALAIATLASDRSSDLLKDLLGSVISRASDGDQGASPEAPSPGASAQA